MYISLICVSVTLNRNLVGVPIVPHDEAGCVTDKESDATRNDVSINLNANQDDGEVITMYYFNRLRINKYGNRGSNVSRSGLRQRKVESKVRDRSVGDTSEGSVLDTPPRESSPDIAVAASRAAAATTSTLLPLLAIRLRNLVDFALFWLLAYLSVPVVQNILSSHQVSIHTSFITLRQTEHILM
jgi:hypothetical protein